MKSILRIISAIVLLVASFGASAQINTDQVMRVGQNALYFEDYMLSIQYFNRVIEAKPYMARAYFLRAIAKLNLEDFRGAEIDASKAIELNPFITDAYEVRGVACQNLGRVNDAIRDYDKALSQLPDNRHLMFNKALAQEEIEDYDGAHTTYDAIIAAHPGYDNAYVGRAKVQIELGDTVAAKADLDHAIELNRNSTNAYVLRANIAMQADDYRSALDDMNEAIRLQPKFAGFFINRAFLRYSLDDYFGAMSDYDYAIILDPLNPVAYYNRGLLRAEVKDNDKAIIDFSRVIEMDPNDMRSLYNRAVLYMEAGRYAEALADIDKVITAFPEFSAPMFTRYHIRELMGDRSGAIRDYDSAIALSKAESARFDELAAQNTDDTADAAASGATAATDNSSASGQDNTAPSGKKAAKKAANEGPETDPMALFANRFSTLLTIENEVNEEQEFNNKSIRGRVQDHSVSVETEPDFTCSFYSSPTELAPSTYYMQEIDAVNSSRQLRMIVNLTNASPTSTDPDDLNRHFRSVDYYNSYLSTHTPRAIDYFGRGMEFFTLRNFEAAALDLSRAIEIAPDFTLAYFMRAVNRTCMLNASIALTDDMPIPDDGFKLERERRRAEIREIIADYDKVSQLSPRSPFPHFNKGNLYLEMQDLTSAIAAYTRAIELKGDFGEAFYNRGYAYFRLGNREAGSSDLSQAGQLGIVPSYSLLKRMDR